MKQKRSGALIGLLALCIMAVIGTASAATQRVALVIGNGAYKTGSLANPVNDATDIAAALGRLGFTVILKTNANQETMEEALIDFGNRLKRGGVGLFYYAGHGVQADGINYLIPIGVKIRKSSDLRYRAVDAGRILDEMQYANNSMNIVILDACRDNPFSRSFRSGTRGLSIIASAPKGTYITYSTSPGNVAADGEGRNSPYTEALLKHMNTPGVPIEHVFKRVRRDLATKTNGRQIPWELSSLSGDFFFRENGSADSREKVTPATPTPSNTYLEEERRKLAEERERLRKEAELLNEKKALEEARRKIEEEKRKIEEERRRLASIPQSDPTKGTRFIDAINAKVTGVKFFESGYKSPSKDQRVYRNSFSRTNTRFVNWELNLNHPAQGDKKNFTIEHLWFNPYGKEIFRSAFNTYVQGNWTWSYHHSGYGWREVSTNTWIAGKYRMDLYVDGVKIASENFTMY